MTLEMVGAGNVQKVNARTLANAASVHRPEECDDEQSGDVEE